MASPSGPPQGPPQLSPQMLQSIKDQSNELDTIEVIIPVLLTFSGITVLLRAYTRGVLLKHVGWDDFFMFTAMAVFCGLEGLCWSTIGVNRRLFHGDQSITIQSVINRAKWINGLYAICVFFVKMSVAYFVVRIYGPHDRWQRWAIIITTFLSTVFGLTYFILGVATCAVGAESEFTCPVYDAYNGISYTYSLINAIGDMMIATLSVMLVVSLSIPRREQISAAVFLVLGTVGGVIAILRCAVILGWRTPDQALTNLVVGRWSMLEVGLTITAGSLATLRPLLGKLRILKLTSKNGTATKSRLTETKQLTTNRNKSHNDPQELDELPLCEDGTYTKTTHVQIVHSEV